MWESILYHYKRTKLNVFRFLSKRHNWFSFRHSLLHPGVDLFHVGMEGAHTKDKVVTDDTSKHLVEMVTSHVGTSVDPGRMFFLAMSPLA